MKDMSTTVAAGEGLLRAIIEDPGADDRRLVYADHLEENGESERAEFIRVQVELARPWSADTGECWQCNCARRGTQRTSGKCRCTDRCKALRRRERELLEYHWQDWFRCLGPWDDLAPAGGSKFYRGYNEQSFEVRRGFVAEVSLTLADWCGTECSRCKWPAVEIRQFFDAVAAVIEWGRFKKNCPRCHGTDRTGARGPALVRACPLERVALTEWQGDYCRHCLQGRMVVGTVNPVLAGVTCRHCQGLYDSDAALAWARDYHYCTDIS